MSTRPIKAWIVVIVAFALGLLLARTLLRVPEAPALERATLYPSARAIPALALVDQDGRALGVASLRGHWTLVFFGFTQCPDVCPTTLSALAETMKSLGADADRVQVVFVTVDPDRDTAEVLASYVKAFNPSFVGLRGDAEAIARTAREFKILYQKQPGRTPESYTVDHSAGTFVFDTQGRLRLYVGNGQGPDVFAHDIRELLRAQG
jgi:protein SCO1/2